MKAVQAASSSAYSCSTKKTCGQMASCEEAQYHLNECGSGQLDSDKDGTPCESICK
ncbi:excalibur calcium-binding domain-containing protein [Azotobacter sp. CWF10]